MKGITSAPSWEVKPVDLTALLGAVQVEADWVGLREVREIRTLRVVRDGNPQQNWRGFTHGIMVEVLVAGQFGYCGTYRLDSASLAQAAERAAHQAQLAAPHAVHHFTPAARPPMVGRYRSPFIKDASALSAQELNGFLLQINAALRVSAKVVSVSATSQIVESTQRLVTSTGGDITQEFLLLEFDMRATAQDGPVIQTRSLGGMRGNCFQTGVEYFQEEGLLEKAREIGGQAVELLSAQECPHVTTDLVLAPDQMMLQIHESVGHALEVDRILGDERNYAGWSFVQRSDFGTLQYGSELMNITFDPTVMGEFASYGYDDGGMKAAKHYLIRKGKLLRGLGGMESQIRSGLPGVANFRATSWNRAPVDRIANLNLEPGDSSLEAIIAAVERGVYMESNRSWSIDDYRNKFQFGCEYAKLIQDGRFTQTLRNPNYRGISVPFWKSLKMVGNRDTFVLYGTPNCGKGEPNQIIHVGHASPVCLFQQVDVFGGA